MIQPVIELAEICALLRFWLPVASFICSLRPPKWPYLSLIKISPPTSIGRSIAFGARTLSRYRDNALKNFNKVAYKLLPSIIH